MPNLLTPCPAPCAPCPVITDVDEIATRYAGMLGDESRMRAPSVRALFLPTKPEEVADALRACREAGWRVVFSGGRTGITGAVAPLDADAVVSLQGMRRILAFGEDEASPYVRLEPGVSLADLDAVLLEKRLRNLPGVSAAEAQAVEDFRAREGGLWFPVDPTERTAHFGGIVANNASGARTYRYGATRKWVRALTVLLPGGGMLTLRRGEVTAGAEGFTVQHLDGSCFTLPVPEIGLPATKCTAGYPLKPGMDAVDLFIGSEGTLGAVVEIELALCPRPEAILGVNVFPGEEAAALSLVEAVRSKPGLPVEAVEYFDPDTIKLLKAKRDAEGKAGHVPPVRFWESAALYIELAGSPAQVEAGAEQLEECLRDSGIDPERTWAADRAEEWEAQKLFRHAVPEGINSLIGRRKAEHPELHKVGTDMAVPDGRLREMFAIYRRDLSSSGLESVVFGHIGDNHVHVNILPRTPEDLKKAKDLYATWAKEAVRLGGTVAAEHGIGRIKKSMLEVQYPPKTLEAMRAVRKAFDPESMLAPGVLV